MILTFEIFERSRNHGKKFLKLCQTSFSGIVHWQEWGFLQLVTALGNWIERNPVNQYESRDKSFATNRNMVYSSKANNKSFRKRACIYCDSDEPESVDCKTVTMFNGRRSILKERSAYVLIPQALAIEQLNVIAKAVSIVTQTPLVCL